MFSIGRADPVSLVCVAVSLLSDRHAPAAQRSGRRAKGASHLHHRKGVIMLRMKHLGVMFLCLCLCACNGSLAPQTAALKRPPESSVVATSGSYQLTEQMVDQAIRFGEILPAPTSLRPTSPH
jgi:hypothetical protein